MLVYVDDVPSPLFAYRVRPQSCSHAIITRSFSSFAHVHILRKWLSVCGDDAAQLCYVA